MNPTSGNEPTSTITDKPVDVSSRDDGIRTKLVNTAAEFLVSPSVQNSSMEMKISFLKKKGLSDAEIDLAIKQSDARLMAIRENAANNTYSSIHHPLAPLHYPPSKWTMFRDIVNSAILLSGFCYGAYWTYHNFILPYFFGKKETKSIDGKLRELDQTVTTCFIEVNAGLGKLREEIEKVTDRRTDSIYKEINDMKSEILSLKKLLLNRKQFPTTAGLTPLSIPSWQISENDEKQQTPEEEGNGSNGSESSLEMIKE